MLTDKQREALELHRAGAGYKQIAQQLGISRETARDRVQAALAAVAKNDTTGSMEGVK